MGFLWSILGIGKTILQWIVGIIQGIFNWCVKNPLMAFFIALDLVLLYGCWWGYGQHRDLQVARTEIVALKSEVEQKNAMISTLSERLNEYVAALKVAQDNHVATIRRNNEAVQSLRTAADDQIARARAEAARTREQRNQYYTLAERYRHAGERAGTAEERIVREEATTDNFVREYQGVR